MEGMIRCSANYVPLSPISFLERAAIVYGDRLSVVYGTVKYTWRETRERCIRLASALTQLGISRGDVVAALAPNIPAMYELHFGVPTGWGSSLGAIEILSKTSTKLPHLVLILESDKPPPINSNAVSTSGNLEYGSLLAMGKPDFEINWPNDEWDPISLNYTSGTTSSPKGVIYSHRGAYLNSIAAALLNEMPSMPVYLWTVPMFHCNGWCLTWAVAAQGGTNVCLRKCLCKGNF
ncbi:hypothetical protein F0562_026896 [Nyssa sinensis]|uniref:AMP-dependent synthetase/ligase domain-containing protein n=1 Tax=Nyssa sinensis TaxID=561372 RepID=A0A5J5B6N4_9ASTE|nr:hypothetical protein F0562_026896 [Nyssa sinensis]